MAELLVYQKPHVEKLIKALQKYNVAIDASDTGTGKTYCALSCAKHFGLKPLIVCPKAVVTGWKRAANAFGVEIEFITNYDQIIGPSITSTAQQEKLLNEIELLNKPDGVDNIDDVEQIQLVKTKNIKKTKKSDKPEKLVKINKSIKPHLAYCKKIFIKNDADKDKVENNDEVDKDKVDKVDKVDKEKKKEVLASFSWTLPEKTLVIFDEVHRCKNVKTLHFKLLISIRNYLSESVKCLVLSATVADKIKYFAPVGYVLGWIDDCSKYAVWLNRKSRDTGFPKSKTLHHLIFPFHGSRIKISELGDLFPKNHVLSEVYEMENAKEIEIQYDIIKNCIENLRTKKDENNCILAKILRARQMIELLKYPTFCELIDDHLESDLSVVVFVNFNDTMMKLANTYNTRSLIHGKQTQVERDKVIDDFQDNKTNLIIVNIKAGGVGISLNDRHGVQRVSIISPTWSGQDTIQCLGRIHRAESKTPAIQKFVFCAGTIEEYICDKLKDKLNTISSINDGILNPYSKLIEVPDEEYGKDREDREDGIKKNDKDCEDCEDGENESDDDNEEFINMTKKVKKQIKKAHKNDKKVKLASEYLNI
jgi:superfamily II DNA or RNA helicase